MNQYTVYVLQLINIESEVIEYVKVGHSTDHLRRLVSLQKYTNHLLEIIYETDCQDLNDAKQLEYSIHDSFESVDESEAKQVLSNGYTELYTIDKLPHILKFIRIYQKKKMNVFDVIPNYSVNKIGSKMNL